MIEELAKKLKYRLSLPLPGSSAHLKMAHPERRKYLHNYIPPDTARKGAVLILLFPDEHAIKTMLILRQEYEGVHSGQIAFPGGKYEEGDRDLAETALREAHEEIGVPKEDITLIGKMTSLYIPPSNFDVHPFIGVTLSKPDFFPSAGEVQKLIEVNIESLSDESLIGEKELTLGNGLKIITPYYNIQGHIVWGATAMIISEFNAVLREIEY